MYSTSLTPPLCSHRFTMEYNGAVFPQFQHNKASKALKPLLH